MVQSGRWITVCLLQYSDFKKLNCCISLALQLTYPGTKISTLDELFDFVQCIDLQRIVHWNIESKINAVLPNATRDVHDFVTLQYDAFSKSGYRLSQITVGGYIYFSMKVVYPEHSTKVLIGER